jgi:predicted nucleotide-binding protein with TIR-like domain
VARIFIGSSSLMIPVVEEIARCLRSRGHEPLPWKEIFQNGDITIDRLLAQARDVDGAILVFSEDDKIEHKGNIKYQPGANILIEFGLFLGCLGRRGAIICNHGDNRKPSDLAGLTYLDVGKQTDRIRPEAWDRLGLWAAELTRGIAGPFGEDGITQVFQSFPLSDFKQALLQARRLHILQTFIPYAQHMRLFEADLMTLIDRGGEVQVLLSSPWSPVVELRQQALSSAYGRNIVREQIGINLEHLAALARTLPTDKRARLEIRVHTAMPSMSIYRVDDLFFAGHYFRDTLAIDSPQLRVTSPQSSMGKHLAEEHQRIWTADTTEIVDLANIDHWLNSGPRR